MRTKWTQMCAREAMIELMGKPGYGEQPRWLEQVAKAANISISHARGLWRGDISNHNHRSAVAVRKALELKRERQARAEAQALAALFQKIIGGMRATDETFYGAQIIQYERLVRQIGSMDRSGNEDRSMTFREEILADGAPDLSIEAPPSAKKDDEVLL